MYLDFQDGALTINHTIDFINGVKEKVFSTKISQED
jgi:hypothetical protein